MIRCSAKQRSKREDCLLHLPIDLKAPWNERQWLGQLWSLERKYYDAPRNPAPPRQLPSRQLRIFSCLQPNAPPLFKIARMKMIKRRKDYRYVKGKTKLIQVLYVHSWYYFVGVLRSFLRPFYTTST
jgi:hypothetical protein